MENIFTLKEMADGLRIRRFIDEQQPRKAVIIGAGYISLEVAEALREREIETTILYRGESPYSGLEPELGPIIVEELKAQGVRLPGSTLHPKPSKPKAARPFRSPPTRGISRRISFSSAPGCSPISK